jgi:hypothetical protein
MFVWTQCRVRNAVPSKAGLLKVQEYAVKQRNLDEHWECVFRTKLKVVLSDHTCVDASETADISFPNLWQLCEERGSPSLWVCWPHFTRFWTRFWTSFWFLHIQTDPHPGISWHFRHLKTDFDVYTVYTPPWLGKSYVILCNKETMTMRHLAIFLKKATQICCVYTYIMYIYICNYKL